LSSIFETYRSNGKLLLTAEYAVLDGAKALAIPTTFGQVLEVAPSTSGNINWKSYNSKGQVWFDASYKVKNNKLHLSSSNQFDATNGTSVSERLIQIFDAVVQLNPSFFERHNGFDIVTRQDFNRHWGLGTSSTLINNIASWANVDVYKLLQLTFGGSGYDIACAMHDTPIIYQLPNHQVKLVDFKPSFSDCLYFVYLNEKQNSRTGIANYKSLKRINTTTINRINTITDAMVSCTSLDVFNALITEHEVIISKLIDLPPVQKRLFSDFDGSIKSLGAWGGDFIMVASEEHPEAYFKTKGFNTILTYDAMVL